MEVAILTVGDELLAGDTENTNASWLGRQLSARGASVERVLVVPDERATIAEYVREWRDAYDAVIVTGGLGGTHDDVTMDAVADAADVDLHVPDEAREAVERAARAYRDANPAEAERFELDLDVESWATVPEDARVIPNEPGLSPGAKVGAIDDGGAIYVFPGVPDEVHAMFDLVAGDFGGDVVSEITYTSAPEGAIGPDLEAVRDAYDVAVGSYPSGEGPNRLKVTGEDPEEVAAALADLEERVESPAE
ncbi:molybdopterin binding motif, CinA N-terminal domain [Halarchaeum acidiphilum MH1-52-1]|uniref:Molybdopterin binding motif, CinA N-terminal domain n=1 Tax=Halarchaeum acidiphilum MH1-52-1 TaxID=1261545 RepID=U3A2D1_9EURY|nr:molybdopterin-binding protein [Halarchaeum acidiphilum]GAD51804.1 molybdopterin binding motif, CinA N-terminal domain [Halarchaeum acidiphilum MH1-52-1]